MSAHPGWQPDWPPRISRVDRLEVIALSYSSVVQLGDHATFAPRLQAIAVQRELDHSAAGEAEFEAYAMFSEPYPELDAFAWLSESGSGICESVAMRRTQVCPDIQVGRIVTLGVSNASLLQIGSSGASRADSRIKHIRQYAPPGPPEASPDVP
ncbi:spore germination protein GerPE [Paenibacillus sp. IB182496]|uniref:Spore germination protein GerPE n=1 Tax=Paenibacillus sabuli TaxID=2772509 RepID=A0A927BUV1_9BACL|nr:spore germination protein GerPE [Paenibacillus sabuli]MBD2847257.1 spore germination protein GerPE [Paenibacillus sabuli]